MKAREEGPTERKFWIAIAVLTFGPIAITFVAIFLGMLFGGAGDAFDAVGPLFLFGMTMVGVLNVGFCLWDVKKGKAEWAWLLVSGVWLIFFGHMFLRDVGLLTS